MDCTPIVLAHEPPFRMGDAEFCPSTREVLHGNQRMIVEPRVMQVLVALWKAQGAVVSKDDLIQQCWSGRVVGEDAINRVISRLRSVGDKPETAFRVETITRVGYRLIAPEGSASPVQPAASPQVTARSPLMERRALLAGGLASVGVAAAALGYYRFGRSTPSQAELLIADAQSQLLDETPEQTASAAGKLRTATELTPDDPHAWGLLSLAYMSQLSAVPASERVDLHARGLAAARRAMALEQGQPDANAALIYDMPNFRNWLASEKACRAALEVHPDHLLLRQLLAVTLYTAGRFADVLPITRSLSTKTSTRPSCITCHANILWNLGRLDEAEALLEKARALSPRRIGTFFIQYYFLLYTGRPRDALTMIEDAGRRPIGIPDWNFDLTAMLAKALIDPSTQRATLAAFEAAAHKGAGFAVHGGEFAAYIGDFDTAFRLLGAYFLNRGFAMPDVNFTKEQASYTTNERETALLFSPMMAEARKDPRFAELTRAIGLDEYWRRTNSRSRVPV